MSSFDLSQAAAVLCHVMREMPADQYVIPVVGYTVPERDSPFHWDQFGWFYTKSYEKAALLTESTGHTYLVNDLGIEPVFLIEEIMRELSWMTELHGGGRCYKKKRTQLLQTMDLPAQAAQVLRDYMFQRAHISEEIGTGLHEVDFIRARIGKVAQYHMCVNRVINPSVLRETGLRRSGLGEKVTDILLELVRVNHQMPVWHRELDEFASYCDLTFIVGQIMVGQPKLLAQRRRFSPVLDYPVVPLYLEYVSGTPNRYDELIMHRIYKWMFRFN
jgi:hypothetical protein